MAYFHLKPIRAARVSEISETTAAALVPNEERVNFHIGHPLQDPRHSSTFLRIALGLDVRREDLKDSDPEGILEALDWGSSERPKLDFLIQLIRKSAPYMPRGGYSRQNPSPLVRAFSTWLEGQQEPLHYDTGEQSARREIILGSGGIQEILRIILFVISSYLEMTPARVLCLQCELQPSLKSIPHLYFEDLPVNERLARDQIEQILAREPEIPTFLLVGSLLEEETRRRLRVLSIERPLFFIEANNAPNHLSLAREAKLEQRVIRLLTPGIFAPRLNSLATIFIAGNADFLKVIENVHFKLKGTPSVSEVELLTYLLDQGLAGHQDDKPAQLPQTPPSFAGLALGITAESVLPSLAGRIEKHFDRLLGDHAQRLARTLIPLDEKASRLARHIHNPDKDRIFDEFSTIGAGELLDQLVDNFQDQDWSQALQQSFLSNFIKHQPHYRANSCLVVSGSSRTALGILGHHCGISEAVISDLSWSYEQCFPTVHAVPLTSAFELDVNAMIAQVEGLCRLDAAWPERGAVVINNPHNATGRVFNEADIRKLIAFCLQNNLHVIDDLAYQNVAPVDDLPEIKTARQIASELVRDGVLEGTLAENLITVHSISKTDCLAGARLAVVEIPARHLRERFEALNSQIQPNIAAIFISYLFHRGSSEATRTYWHLRNTIFHERISALLSAAANLPAERNPFGLHIIPPLGSMYPLLQIDHLPAGLSLDWLASSLARQGIGLLPLGTFARTEKGYETGRKTFRLTLGGADKAEVLLAKTRRLLIDLNRLIAEEEARYNRKSLKLRGLPGRNGRSGELSRKWEVISGQILRHCERSASFRHLKNFIPLDRESLEREFFHRFLPERLDIFRTRLLDRALINDELRRQALGDRGEWLAARLEREFYKDSLQRRQDLFRLRSFDRTVHPTQMYSIRTEIAMDELVAALVANRPVPISHIENTTRQLYREFLGLNVAITSLDEADEILLDLAALSAAEDYTGLFTDASQVIFLSFWSDWDGSNRPSGQGHRFVGAAVMENVRRLARILNLLRRADPALQLSPDLLSEIELLPERNQRFTGLLNSITLLTHQLEQRYRGILPISVEATPIQRLEMRLNLRRDPARVLWQHNDRYERKMLDLRRQRRNMLEFYFDLNKKLRKQLHASIPVILENRSSEQLLGELVGYHDILQRTVITPRIHQGLITARDQFAIDTTVYNIDEINSIAGKYGNPGMVLAMQISLSTKPEALISLDRKMSIQKEQMLREIPDGEVPSIWLIPLLEDLESVENITAYLDRVWEYATQSRQSTQSPHSRFAEFISEIFIAGSDLSQQVGQAAGAFLYHKVKYDVQSWLAEHGLAEAVRIKLGSGEPMQRQGGYYSFIAGHPAFINSDENRRRLTLHLPAAARKSTEYAVTPLQGVFLGGDLRTYQSNLAERLRTLPVNDLANLLYHARETQLTHRDDLIRAAETLTESRLGEQLRSVQEMERLTVGTSEPLYEGFLDELTANFRQILYGLEEDVIGIHAITYFIGRSLPQLRDRPTSRRTPGTGLDRGQQILANIAEIIPLEKQGSLLRAIAHNQAQTVVLGINQLTTGLFRTLERFAQKSFGVAERERLIAERLLPHLPIYEILRTLRIYQDSEGEFLKRIATAFPAGNSAFVALREDSDALQRYLPLFQQELLRRHGLNVSDFFLSGTFIPDLLPNLRPDLAVLLQKNLFNTDINKLLAGIKGRVAGDWRVAVGDLLHLPLQIRYWRKIIWEVMGDSLYQRVHSFAELAAALYSFSATRSFAAPAAPARGTRLSPALASFFRTARADDEMRHFLIGTLEYLSSFAEGNIEVPISIIRAMNDVERIAQIEETALPPAKQDVIRFCMLQIAQLAGDNG